MPTSLQSLGYLPVSTATLYVATVLDFDLYVQHPGRDFAELYRERKYPLLPDDLARLRASGIDHLYIRLQDKEAYGDYLRQHVLYDSAVPLPTRMRALRDVARVAFEDALRLGNCDEMTSVAGGFGRDLAGMLADQAPAFQELFKTLDHDYYTFTHTCNVSTYCAVLAVRLGRYDAVEVAQIAAGGILHDIGKRHIPLSILNKTSKLTDAEWEVIKQHPVTGYRELAARDDLTEGQLMMVYQHHERLDGSGYPAGITSDEIHPWVKICAVADVFDAMTCQRSYRRAIPVAEVFSHLRKMAGIKFDEDIVDCWLSQTVPSGTTVSVAQ